MAQHYIRVSKLIEAPAAKVYSIIADYHNGHRHILPEAYFVSLKVEQGGVGAGTIVSFQMQLMGRVQDFRATITEPEPGQTLVEHTNTGAITTFRVEPQQNGQHAQVTISTETSIPDGWLRSIQGWLTTQLLRPIYIKELEQLAAFATK